MPREWRIQFEKIVDFLCAPWIFRGKSLRLEASDVPLAPCFVSCRAIAADEVSPALLHSACGNPLRCSPVQTSTTLGFVVLVCRRVCRGIDPELFGATLVVRRNARSHPRFTRNREEPQESLDSSRSIQVLATFQSRLTVANEISSALAISWFDIPAKYRISTT